MRMTDARLDRTASAWHAEFARWSLVNNPAAGRYEIWQAAKGNVDTRMVHTVGHLLRFPKIDAEAWLNTYRNRAAARAALSAADGSKK